MASSSDGTNEEPTSTAGVMKSIAKIEGGSTYLKESMSTFSSASIDGKAQKGDVRHSDADMPGALAVLKSMVGKAKEAAPEGKKKEKWAFRASPHAAMGKTLDDTFIAFLMWGRTSAADEDDDDATPTEINISKAFRRLEVYAEWMEENAADLITSPLTFESVKEVNEAWTMSASYDDKGRLVWWVDLGKLNVPAIKKIPIEDSFRGMVWFTHAVMYDPKAQLNGMVMCETLGRIGFYSAMTLVPMKLGAKLDKLTMGVLPVKMKLILCLDSPRWMSVMMKVFGMFMSKKMRSRIKIKKQEWGFVSECFGAACIPKGFGECEGTLTEDPVLAPYAKEGGGAVAMEVS